MLQNIWLMKLYLPNGAADEPREAEARSADASDGSIHLVRPVRPKPAQTEGWTVTSSTFWILYKKAGLRL